MRRRCSAQELRRRKPRANRATPGSLSSSWLCSPREDCADRVLSPIGRWYWFSIVSSAPPSFKRARRIAAQPEKPSRPESRGKLSLTEVGHGAPRRLGELLVD